MTTIKKILALVALSIAMVFGPALAASAANETYPNIVDNANLFTQDEVSQLAEAMSGYAKYNVSYIVYTKPSLNGQTPAEAASNLVNEIGGIGPYTAFLFISPEDDSSFVILGSALSSTLGTLPAYVQQNIMLPAYMENRYYDGTVGAIGSIANAVFSHTNGGGTVTVPEPEPAPTAPSKGFDVAPIFVFLGIVVGATVIILTIVLLVRAARRSAEKAEEVIRNSKDTASAVSQHIQGATLSKLQTGNLHLAENTLPEPVKDVASSLLGGDGSMLSSETKSTASPRLSKEWGSSKAKIEAVKPVLAPEHHNTIVTDHPAPQRLSKEWGSNKTKAEETKNPGQREEPKDDVLPKMPSGFKL